MLLKRSIRSGTISVRTLSIYKRWEIGSFSPNFSSLQLSESHDPPIVDSASKVLVEIKAASINPIDVLISQGYGQSLFRLARVAVDTISADKLTYDKFPMVLGRDFSGVIVNKGAAVDKKFKIGDRVWGVIPPYNNHGSHASHVIACSSHISHQPSNLSDVEAAAIPYAGLTAYSAISCFGGLNEGNAFNRNVLVLGGSGGVGLFAIQILKSWGSIVTTTCNKDAVEWLKSESGADKVVDYNDANEISQLKNSFDVIINSSSGDKRVLDGTFDCLKKDRFGCARYITLTSPWLKNYDSKGYIFGSIQTLRDASCDTLRGFKDGRHTVWAYFVPNGQALEHIKRLVEENQVKPKIQNTFDFDHVKDGYMKVAEGHARGKTVIKTV